MKQFSTRKFPWNFFKTLQVVRRKRQGLVSKRKFQFAEDFSDYLVRQTGVEKMMGQ